VDNADIQITEFILHTAAVLHNESLPSLLLLFLLRTPRQTIPGLHSPFLGVIHKGRPHRVGGVRLSADRAGGN